MSDWGEDEVEAALYEPGPTDDSGRAFGLDIGTLAVEFVDAAVKAAVRQQVAEVAAEAVKAFLTHEALDTLRDRAETAATAAVTEQVEADASGEEGSEPVLQYGSVDEFVREYLRHVYRRPVRKGTSGRVWAARWWEYDEAAIRLEALWRSWEFLRQDASTGMSVWWRDHADHHMAVLMDPSGPFEAADHNDPANSCGRGEPLPYEAPPSGLYPDVRDAPAAPTTL